VTLDATLGVRVGRLDLHVGLVVEPGEVVALLGPNGAGKTTALRCLAGLQPITAGAIHLDGTVLDDPATNTFVPVERRPVGVVFQEYLLFAHLSALENVAFPLRARGRPRAEARRRAAAWLERVGLADHAGNRPRGLSGGQAQRVALARALVAEPRLLLLDEPLAALDAGTRGEVRRDLRRHLDGFDGMCVLVTHDPVDAHALADRVVVLDAGSVVQAGTLAAVTAHPRSRYVADLVGVNLLGGRREGSLLRLDGGATLTVADEGEAGPVLAAVHPHAVSLHRGHPEGSPRNVWRATVADLDRVGDRVRVQLAGPVALVAEITAGAVAELALQPGDEVWVSVKATEIVTYPA
jgi:molybdate transport system ATP-binding protein